MGTHGFFEPLKEQTPNARKGFLTWGWEANSPKCVHRTIAFASVAFASLCGLHEVQRTGPASSRHQSCGLLSSSAPCGGPDNLTPCGGLHWKQSQEPTQDLGAASFNRYIPQQRCALHCGSPRTCLQQPCPPSPWLEIWLLLDLLLNAKLLLVSGLYHQVHFFRQKLSGNKPKVAEKVAPLRQLSHLMPEAAEVRSQRPDVKNCGARKNPTNTPVLCKGDCISFHICLGKGNPQTPHPTSKNKSHNHICIYVCIYVYMHTNMCICTTPISLHPPGFEETPLSGNPQTLLAQAQRKETPSHLWASAQLVVSFGSVVIMG